MAFESAEVELSVEERIGLQRDMNPTDPAAPWAVGMAVPVFGVVGWALLDPNSPCLPGDTWFVPLRLLGFLCAGVATLSAMVLGLALAARPLMRRTMRKSLRARTHPEAYRLAWDEETVALVYNTGVRIVTPLAEARAHSVRDRRMLVLAGGRIVCLVPDRALPSEELRTAFGAMFGTLDPHTPRKVRGRSTRAR